MQKDCSCLAINFWKKITLVWILLFIATITVLSHPNILNWRFRQFSALERQNCSFDHISACQIGNTKNRTFLYVIRGNGGFCSKLNQVLLGFAYSIANNRHFLIDGRQWNYGNFTDYFNPLSTNDYPQAYHTFLVENNDENDRIDHLKTTKIETQNRQFQLATQHVQSIEIKRHVAHYLWKSMTDETWKFIQTCKLSNLSDYIGIHVRKGDKLIKEAREIPLAKYIQIIERIFNRNNKTQHLFVASDDHRVIKTLRQLRPIWNFVSVQSNSNSTGHVQSRFNHLSSEEKLFATRLLMCELQMFIDSQYVVCTMSSNICRLIQILRHQHPSTVISLD